ncbi:unnamed protein product [Callosobruchus maculatus]|uniref:Uncharacterized protein n=1 Tax=Callosobruchus maculatus TaxID=64391 RepID=A0A653D7E2_CALMS|nr:unnamed protein product [Callosobruchus maculatus]
MPISRFRSSGFSTTSRQLVSAFLRVPSPTSRERPGHNRELPSGARPDAIAPLLPEQNNGSNLRLAASRKRLFRSLDRCRMAPDVGPHPHLRSGLLPLCGGRLQHRPKAHTALIW